MEEEMAIAAAAGSPPGYYDFVGSDLSVGKCHYILGSHFIVEPMRWYKIMFHTLLL